MSRYKWAIVAVVAFMIVVAVWNSVFSFIESVPALTENVGLPVIIIDPGHGGLDGGAVGVDNIVEKDINLNIALVMRDMFQINGFEVVMTREEDISIHDEGIGSVRGQKTSDLKNRLKLVEQYPNAVFISIHQNKFGDSRSRGTQVFYSPNNQNSMRLAEILQEDFVRNLQPDNNRKYKQAGKNLYLMTKATCPAVLVECGFLSNSDEAHKLIDKEYQSKVAFTVFCGVMKYLELDQPLAPSAGIQL